MDLLLIGIGSGNPDHLTLQAVKALNSADLVLIPEKGDDKSDLADLRRSICHAVLDNDRVRVAGFAMPERDPDLPYREAVSEWHDAIAQVWRTTIQAHLPQGGGRVALMVWGDPSLYDSTLRIAARLEDDLAPRITVVPGITSIQALTAAHAIPLNTLADPFVVTTGRQLRDKGWPGDAATVVVLLDGACSFRHLSPDGIDIFWAAYAGMDIEMTHAGPLTEVAEQIISSREQARAEHGWIMDIYLLRKSG